MALFRKLFYRKPPDGLLEISERVYVFDCCFTTDVMGEEDYRIYMGNIVSHLRDHFPDASFMVFNFREGESPSQIANVLSEYDMTVMDYPRQYEGCPLLTMEMIHHFLRSSESWLSLGHQNVLLMHCERGGWPVLSFMLAALLIYRKNFTGEQKTLDMIYKQAPRELLQLMSPLNPLPSQLRYLQYVSRRNVGSEWPPLDRALTLDCVILRVFPAMDREGSCRPIFRIYGQDPFIATDRTPKVLFSTPNRSETFGHYKQVDCELVKIDINCHIQGDVVLECISLDDGLEREELMFRVMFNTAFIRSNILMLNREEIDILWNAKDQFPKDFRTEVLFSEIDATTSLTVVDLSGMEEKEGLPVEAFAKVQEIFSNVDWLDPKTDVVNGFQQNNASNILQDNLELKPQEQPKPKVSQSDSRTTSITPLKPSLGSNINKKKIEHQELQVALQRPAQSKIILQRILPHSSSQSNPVSYCNSLQGSPVAISRYHSAPSALGITALLHDHAAYRSEESTDPLTVSSLSSSPSVSSIDPKKPMQPQLLSILPSPTPPFRSEETSDPLTVSPSSSSSLSVDPEKSTQPQIPSISASPPPPPLPPPSSLGVSAQIPTAVKRTSATPPPPPLPSSLGVSAQIPTTMKRTSATAPPPTLQTLYSAPPPPPPPPENYSKLSPMKNAVAKAAPPPPPPPPPSSASPPPPSPVLSGSAPPPPPPPSFIPKGTVSKSSQPPPAPSAKGLLKASSASVHPHPTGNNGNLQHFPGPPSSAPFGGKGRGQTRANPKNQSQTKKSNLKPYHWLKLTRAMQGSLWAEAQKFDEASKAPEFDMSELESLFSAAIPNSDHGNTGSKSNRRSLGPKSDKVQLIDLRRAYNCEIMLTKVKIPLPDLMGSVLALDDSALDVDQVDNLIKFCPTKEEMELLKNYHADKGNLGKCEQFFLELMKVPRVESKLRVFSFKIQFSSQVSDLRSNLNVVNSASEEIRNSVKLKKIMQTILSLGNALNHGTARGSAIGFRLDSLLKLTETRARNNKITLMNYLCKVLADKLPELLDFPKDLVNLEASTKIQLKYLAEEMQAISKGLEKVVEELTASENDGPVSETFCKTLKEFLGFAEAEVRSLASLYSGVGRNADALALYFGEDPTRCPFEQVVSTLLNFVRMFVRAHEENCKQLEFERKRARKEA